MEPAARSTPSRSADARRRAGAFAVALTLALCSAACGGSGRSRASRENLSIVVLGDSVAAGEGIAYGYRYAADARPPRWVGGVRNPSWLPPYPACHQAAQAYGYLVARTLQGHLVNLACTGASYENGIIGPERGATGPEMFGDWAHRRDLNARYDEAAPDIVLVTFGADDLRFVRVVVTCVEAALRNPSLCTAANPGRVVQSDVLDALPKLSGHYRALVAAIRARARAHHHESPFVIFTTYYDPLPAPGADTSLRACPDAAGLTNAQLSYLHALVGRLDATITTALRDERDVAVADVHHAFDGHQWCSHDPWAYGPSVLLLDRSSQAPFHPTPAGQAAIAARVLAQLAD